MPLRGGLGSGGGKARETEWLVVAVAVEHEIRILPSVARGGSEGLEILVFLGAEVVVQASHARGGERSDFECFARNGDRTREAITGTVAGDPTRFEEVACTLGRGGVPLRSARSHSVPGRASSVDGEVGACEAVVGLCVEEQEAPRSATVRNEMAASFMGEPQNNRIRMRNVGHGAIFGFGSKA